MDLIAFDLILIFETERFDKRIGLTGWYKQIVKSQEIECSSVQST